MRKCEKERKLTHWWVHKDQADGSWVSQFSRSCKVKMKGKHHFSKQTSENIHIFLTDANFHLFEISATWDSLVLHHRRSQSSRSNFVAMREKCSQFPCPWTSSIRTFATERRCGNERHKKSRKKRKKKLGNRTKKKSEIPHRPLSDYGNPK